MRWVFRSRATLPLALLLTLVFIAGCATFGGKPWADYTPKEKALAMMQTYNIEFEDTMALAKEPNITEAQKKVVRAKKAILKELKPLITLYDDVVTQGGVPSAQVEAKILQLINKLTMLSVGG